MAAPNLINATTITGKTAVANVSTTATTFLTNGSSSGKVFKINSVIVSNINGASAADFSLALDRGGVYYHIASTISVPADASLTAIEKGIVIYLEENDGLRVTASANAALQVVCSYEEIV